jgi:hypothetical protein
MTNYRLSKSKYVRGLICLKALWLTIHAPEKQAPPSAAVSYRFEKGIEVGLLAQGEFPGGITVQTPSYLAAEAVEETASVLQTAPSALFEAAFFYDNILVRVDVLRRCAGRDGGLAGTWDLIEVKSTTAVKPEHLGDVAVQQYVLQGCGLRLGGAYLMHLDPDCRYPDFSNLFRLADVGAASEQELRAVPETLERFKAALSRSEEPEVRIGPQCDDPYECPFKAYCWRQVPEVSIFNIPRLKAEQKVELISRDILKIEDLPPEYPLSETQSKFVSLYCSGRSEIDAGAIGEWLGLLRFPLYFLDFETDSPAVPRYDGTHPFEKVPFQYSCHRLEADGSLSHQEYLHGGPDDPRPSLARSLAAAVGGWGNIVVYNAAFERGVLASLAAGQPEFEQVLKDMIGRIRDLLELFRLYYLDPAFRGSNSIKNVLPVLVPGMSYEDLEVRDGTEAQMAWNRMIFLEPCPERRRLQAALLSYCRQDSLAMVEIFKVLQARY